MKKITLEFALGVNIPSEIDMYNKHANKFFSEFVEIEKNDIKSIATFFSKWGINPTNSLVTSKDPYGSITEAFGTIQTIYLPIISKVIKRQYSELTENEIAMLNKNLDNIHLKIFSPNVKTPVQKHSHIPCFYSGDKLDMDVTIRSIGHPDVALKESRIQCILKRREGAIECKYTKVDEDLLSYLNKQAESSLINKYMNQWIVESIKLNTKGEYEIILYIEGVDSRKIKEKTDAILSTFVYKTTLENFVCKKIWDYVYLPENHKYQNLCKICYRPISRKGSNHCGREKCKKQIKLLNNKAYYSSKK